MNKSPSNIFQIFYVSKFSGHVLDMCACICRSQCFKSAWMTTVLHDGLHFPRLYKEFTSAKLVNGREIQWTLGALLFKTRYYPLRSVELRILLIIIF